MSFLLTLPLALLLDFMLGEPKRFHPLVGFGYLADKTEARLNQGAAILWRGVLAWLVVVLPIVVTVYLLDQLLGGWWLSVLCG